MPGLAHFCEHLLFMVGTKYTLHFDCLQTIASQGTEQFPRENEYSEAGYHVSRVDT